MCRSRSWIANAPVNSGGNLSVRLSQPFIVAQIGGFLQGRQTIARRGGSLATDLVAADFRTRRACVILRL